jgi:hypothetical protein
MDATESYKSYLKSPYLSIKHSSYFDAYDALFGRYRGQAITFVEVGILGGGSLFMWRDFFGPKARIIGIDLNPAALRWQEHGFEIHIGSQSDPQFWKDFRTKVGEVDILLDDGGHTYAQQIITTEAMLGAIRDGGVLVVEDTHTSYMDGFGPDRFSFIAYAKQLVDGINRRSGVLEPDRPERRIWSVQFFESIVAFQINRAASTAPCVQTSNGRDFDGTQDFRYMDRKPPSLVLLMRYLGPFLARMPGWRRFRKHLRDRADLKRHAIDRFFR